MMMMKAIIGIFKIIKMQIILLIIIKKMIWDKLKLIFFISNIYKFVLIYSEMRKEKTESNL